MALCDGMYVLKLRQYKKVSMDSYGMFVLKLPRFFRRQYGEGKSTAISKLIYHLTPSSHSCIIIALVEF